MTSSEEHIAKQVAKATDRLGQLKARQLLKDMREATRARAQLRRTEMRRRMEFGGAVISAGFERWEPTEVLGVLLDAHDRVASSPTMRLGLRKRGETALSASETLGSESSRTPESRRRPLVHMPRENRAIIRHPKAVSSSRLRDKTEMGMVTPRPLPLDLGEHARC